MSEKEDKTVDNLKKVRDHLVRLRNEAAEQAGPFIDSRNEHAASVRMNEVVAMQEKIEVVDRAIADAEKSGYTYGMLNNI